MKGIDEIAKQIRDAISRESTPTSSSTEPPPTPPTPPTVPGVGKPDCPLCHGIGYVRLDVPVDHPHFGKLYPCSCRLAELQEQRAETLRSFGSLENLERLTFETFRPEGQGISPERQENLRRAYDTTRAYAQQPTGWLFIRGGYGCGKTHLAAAIANTALAQGQPVIFVTVPDLLDHLRAAYAPTGGARYDQRFHQVRTVPLLLLDDLGTENTTPWALEKLFQLLNYRYMSRLPTVITTNHALEELEPRLRSRLADPELVQIVTILAPDYRQAGADPDHSELNTLPLYRDMTFESFDLRHGELDREQSKNLERALELARTYAVLPEGWLALNGPYGCGKTHLAAAIANARVQQGHPAFFIVVPDLLDHLRATYNPQSTVTYDKRFDEVRHAPFLVLDDLGTESATPWAQEKLFQLFNHRYVSRLPTIVTTARPLDDLDPKLRARLLDVTRCTIFGIVAPAYRGQSAPADASRRGGGRKR